MTTLAREVQVSNSNTTDLQYQYDIHLSFAHQNGLVVKHLDYKDSKTRPVWKICCIEIVIFYDGGSIGWFYDDDTIWGHGSNTVVYMAFSSHSLKFWKTHHYQNFLHFSGPIFLVIVDSEQNINWGKVLYPASNYGQEKWKSFKDSTGQLPDKFPTGDSLMKSRRLLDYNQQMFRLPVYSGWLKRLTTVDCENHRYFLSIGSLCSVPYGPIQVLMKSLNFTFSLVG